MTESSSPRLLLIGKPQFPAWPQPYERITMKSTIIAGILWHLVRAASAACFYASFKQVKKWSWETMWAVGGVIS